MPARAVTARSLVLGFLLAPVMAWWNASVETIRYAGQPTTVSLYPHVIFVLLCLILANAGLGKLKPALRLSPGELMTTYFFILMAAVMSSHDSVEVLTPILSYPFRYATTANKWTDEIVRYIPAWLMVSDPSAVDKYYVGNASLWNGRDIGIWIRPIAIWTGFLTVLVGGVACLNVLLRKQWVEHEKLAYPLAQLPVDLVQPRVPLFGNRGFWAAFALACVHDMWFGLHTLWPAVPEPYTRWQTLEPYLTAAPWNSITWLPLAFFPWIMALGVLLPLDLLFSCCAFFWLWKLQPVVASVYGFTDIPRFPFVFEQSFGAYAAIALATTYTSRHALARGFRAIWAPPSDEELGEAISCRAAALGFVACQIALFTFFWVCGMTPWVIIVTLLIYLTAAVAITRLRAELGTPAHDLGQMGPMRLIPMAFGTDGLSRTDLAMFAPIHGFNRNYRASPMAVHAEGLFAAGKTGVSQRGLFAALLLAAAWGTFSGMTANVALNYHWGAASMADPPYVSTIFGKEPYDHIANVISTGVPPAQHRYMLWAMSAGFAVAMALSIVRMNVVGFLLHPVGYAISANWCMSLMWFSLSVALVVKFALVRYGGLRLYRRATPVFLGIILGECTMGSIWMLISIFTGTKTFIVWPYG